jgi:hypothetical protein
MTLNAVSSDSGDFPLADLHAHVGAELPLACVVQVARENGVKLGVVEHGGRGQKISDDETLHQYVESLEAYPVYKGLQAEGLDWDACFSTAAITQLDYVLSDALTFPERDGSLVRLWRPEVRIEDAESFMDRYVDFTEQVLGSTSIDIIANFTFLPACIADQYDVLWTRERMEMVVCAAVEHGVAIEINDRYRIPSPLCVTLACDAGARFCFGSNQHGDGIGRLDYPVRIAQECGLEEKDMFVPERKSRNG